MAILKNISIHGSKGVASCINYVDDASKNSLILSEEEETAIWEGLDDDVTAVLRYAENYEKTVWELDGDKTMLVSGVNCEVDVASDEFALSKSKYEEKDGGRRRRGSAKYATYTDKKTGKKITVEKKSIDAEHIIQSFPGKEHGINSIPPELVHRMGVEFARRAFPEFQCVVSTHMNTDHIHNHIVVCAYAMDGSRKVCMNKKRRNELRKLNDEMSLAYDLPILIDADIDNKKREPDTPNINEEYVRTHSSDGMSNKDHVRHDIETALEICKKRGVDDWQGFVKIMTEEFRNPVTGRPSYEISETTRHVLFLNRDLHMKDSSETFKVRDTSLGEKYMRKAICTKMGWDALIGFDDKGVGIIEKQILPHEKKDALERKREHIDYTLEDRYKKTIDITIGRYDENGHRRSILEIIFITAIQFLKFFKDKLMGRTGSFFDRRRAKVPLKAVPYVSEIDIRIHKMQRAMYAANLLGLKTPKDIEERKREVGKAYSQVKQHVLKLEKSVKHYQVIEDLIMDLRSYEKLLKGRDLSGIDRLLSYPDKATVRRQQAALEPITQKQKQELYLVLNENANRWKLTCKYTELTFVEAEQIIRFLKHKSDRKPKPLISYEEYEKNREERYNEAKYRNAHVNTAKPVDTRTEEDKLKEFNDILLSVDMETAQYFIQYKNLKQKAINLGLTKENYGDYLNYLDVLEGMLQASVYNLRSLTGDYINLSRLEEDTKLARDHSFTHGPYEAFVRDQEPAPEVKEPERSRKDDVEPDYEEERDNRSTSWTDLYDGLGH